MRVLAVDGGQSAIRFRCGDQELTRDGVSRLEVDTAAWVVDQVAAAWQDLGRPELDCVSMGLTTAPPAGTAGNDEAAAIGHAVLAATGATRCLLTSDAVIAHAGALAGDTGIVVRVGTGIACVAGGGRLAARIFDGHGFLLGDEGGAFWIGRAGIRAALAAHDFIGPPTELTAAVEQHFGPIADVPAVIHSLPRAVDAIAQFAPRVVDLAPQDEQARLIVGDAAHALARTVRGAAAYAALAIPGTIRVVIDGALTTREPLASALAAQFEGDDAITTQSALGDPLSGAEILATQPAVSYLPLVRSYQTRETP